MKNILLVLANSRGGRGGEFSSGHDGPRLVDAPALPDGFELGRRFELADASMTRDAADRPYRYLELYEADDLEVADEAAHRNSQTAPGAASDARDSDRRTWWYRPISDVLGTPTDPRASARKLLLAFSNAADGRDDQFNEWYNGTHLREILDVDDTLLNAQRFQLVGDARLTRESEDAPYKYVAIYEASDIAAADAAIYALARTARDEALAAGRRPPLTVSTSMSRDMRTWWWTSIGPVIDRTGSSAIHRASREAAQ